MRWFVTGDIHGDITSVIRFIEKYDLTKDDNIIVLGDFGIFWRADMQDAQFKIEQYERSCNGVHLYWIDGNHENFNIINSWNCKGVIYNNSEHIHYCPRGSVLNINGKKALCIGGADSVDKFWRRENIEWWADEAISDEDVDRVAPDYYDYVFTHCCPYDEVQQSKCWLFTLSNISESNAIHYSEKQLQKMFNKIDFGHHYYAHYHVNKQTSEKHTCLYEDFIELNGENEYE